MKGTLAITMAGFGSRFQRAGYTEPKYKVSVLGRPLFDWSMLSLQAFRENEWQFSFAVRAADNSRSFIEQRCAMLELPLGEFIALNEPTDGQATTAYLLAQASNPDLPFAIFNIDTLVRPGAICPADIPDTAHGWIPCFPGPGEGWSFARTDETGQVIEMREKKRISENATVGFYWFRSADLYIKMYRKFFSQGRGEEKGERYVAPLYNQLVADGLPVNISSLHLNDLGMLGTPEQVKSFESTPPQFVEKLNNGRF